MGSKWNFCRRSKFRANPCHRSKLNGLTLEEWYGASAEAPDQQDHASDLHQGEEEHQGCPQSPYDPSTRAPSSCRRVG